MRLPGVGVYFSWLRVGVSLSVCLSRFLSLSFFHFLFLSTLLAIRTEVEFKIFPSLDIMNKVLFYPVLKF